MATYISNQCSLSHKIPPASTFSALAQVDSFSGPTFQTASLEITNLSDTSKKYRPGIVDSGEMTFELRFDPADSGHIAMKSLVESPETASFQLSIPTTPATLFTFDGFPTSFEITGGQSEDLITASCTIKITGSVVVTTAGGGS